MNKIVNENNSKCFLPLNLQFFAEQGSEGEQTNSVEGTQTETSGTDTQQSDNKDTNNNKDQSDNKPLTTEAIEKIIQSRVDKSNAELGKTIAQLRKENDKLRKESLSSEELKKFEINEKEKELAEREKTLLDRENRLFAIKAIKEIGLDDGSENSLKLVDFVIADDEAKITDNVKAFNELVQSFVSARVDSKFKELGRTPNGAKPIVAETKQISVAEKLGKAKAEQDKKSNDILNMYLGGKR